MTLVDYQCHWIPEPVLEAVARRRDYPRAERVDGTWVIEVAEGHRQGLPPEITDIERQLEDADALGIDVLVSSPVLGGEVFALDAWEAAEHLKMLNALVAAAQHEYAGRFYGLAVLPLQDAGAATTVLEHAVDQGLRAVFVPASIDGRSIATDATLPVFHRLSDLGMPVFLHPVSRTNTLGAATRLGEVGLGWMYHTTLAALNLIESGTLDVCPSLSVVHPHLGGVLPYILARLELVFGRPITPYLRTNFYVDVVSGTPGALSLALETYGRDRLLFATDYPFVPAQEAVAFIDANATEEDAAAIRSNRIPGLLDPPRP